MICNVGVSLDLHRIFKYLLECDSSDAVCFPLSDRSSLEVWRHCHCYSNSGNVTGEADFVKIVATFKYYLLSCLDTHTHSYPHLFCNSTIYMYQLSSVASWFTNATRFGHLLRAYEHLQLLLLLGEALLLYPRQRQKAGCVFISGGCFPPPTGPLVILSRRSNQRTA